VTAFFSMSVKIMSDVFENSKTEGNARLVLLCLADCANDEGVCWPSIRKICQKANLSEPMTKKHLNSLIAVGVVKKEEREEQSGRQTSNYYTIDVEQIGNDQITREVIERVTPKSRMVPREGLTLVSGGGANASYPVEGVTPVSLSYMNHNKEPKIEPSEESSAKASHSSSEFNHVAESTKCANAQPAESDDSFSIPPQQCKIVKPRESKNSPPKKRQPKLADDSYFEKLKQIYPNIDMEKESRAMDAWLLSRPNRPKSQQFVSSWINRAAERMDKNSPTPKLPNGEIDWANVRPND
jgi:hypothetical protein